MKNNYHKLYAIGVHGLRKYQIWSEGSVIKILANGVMYEEDVKEGKVNRTIDEQVALRIASRIRVKLDNGFVYNKNELGDTPSNQLGYHMPMLANRMDKFKGRVPEKVFIQPKLDGHRCLTNCDTPYTRRGKAMDTLGDLMDPLNIPEGITLDGELYVHNTRLQTIASWAKRRQANTEKLQYHIYDVIIDDEPDASFETRFNVLNQIVTQSERIRIVPTKLIRSSHIFDAFNIYRKRSYEGAMVRMTEGSYGIGKRSNDLLKIKHYFDDEFECEGMHKSSKGRIVLDLLTKDGKKFTATAPGTEAEKHTTYAHKEDYVGMKVTVQYAEYTSKGIPFQPVAIRWLNIL